MTIREALKDGCSALTLSGCDTQTPQLDTSLLLAFACGISREKLYMELPDEIDEKRLELFRTNIKRRISGEPVAWIIGKKEFWGLDFSIGPGVLCPRPDSEILIEAALDIMDKKKIGSLHDCCTGPGTLALTLASERPSWDISASDISEQAADFFKVNNKILTSERVRYSHSDLMNGIKETFDIIVSNPPYLTPMEMDDKIALGWKEPELALDGGGIDGLNLIRRLIPRISDRINSQGAVLIEADPLQMPIIKQILSDTCFVRISFRQDLTGRNRIVIAFKE